MKPTTEKTPGGLSQMICGKIQARRKLDRKEWHKGIRGKALFVLNPRTVYELKRPHRPVEKQEYVVVRDIHLSEIDYENFCMDMLVARDYIEENASLCFEGKVIGCLRISTIEKPRDGILVLPYEGPFVKYAAYYRADGCR